MSKVDEDLKKVNILGNEYTIIMNASLNDYPVLRSCNGFIDFSTKKIVIAKQEKTEDSLEDSSFFIRKVLRHEITHAFLYESGLDVETWARNEEMIDWIAIQFEKMLNAFITVGAIK